MKTLSGFVVLLLVGLAAAAPTSDNSVANDTLVITEEFYPEEYLKYTAKHDIVNLLVPINSLNFDENDLSANDSKEIDDDIKLFFVEADITPEGKRIDRGLYIFENGAAKKLLDNGRDAAASADDSKKVFFAANDGIYVYENGDVQKYGSLQDSIVAIAVGKFSDLMYILTEDHQVYNVTDNGNKKEKVNGIVNAQQIVLDYSNNLYFYSDDKQPKVLTSEGVKKIGGLPLNPLSVTLMKSPFIIEDGVPLIADNNVYIIYANGSSEYSEIEVKPQSKPTAYAPEAALIQYYAHDKKIYEYNFVVMLLSTMLDEIKSVLQEHAEVIQSLPTKLKNLSK